LSTAIAIMGGQQTSLHLADEYSPKNGNFSIKFPGKPKETTQTTKIQNGDVKVSIATFVTSDGNVYMVSYSDLPANATKPDNLKTLFDGVREGAKGKDGKIRDDEAFEFGTNKLPAHKLDVLKGEQIVKLWVIVRENRLYQIAVVGTDKFADSKEATAFLESFRLTK
jgi:hypothetical protein